jgi:hypothetical protein
VAAEIDRPMFWPSRLAFVLTALLLVGSASGWSLANGWERRGVAAGFWFGEVSFESERLGGPLTRDDIETIRSVARSELTRAFDGLAITFADQPRARYRVRVVQELRDLRFSRNVGIAGQSRAVSGFGGDGAVSFLFLASSAVAYAPADDGRRRLVEAIGRGVGRAAVHEFVHMLLPRAPIHDSRDARSYEYASAARREQYFGNMRWDLARPLLERRLRRVGRGAVDQPRGQ